jgi:hypothetical protein
MCDFLLVLITNALAVRFSSEHRIRLRSTRSSDRIPPFFIFRTWYFGAAVLLWKNRRRKTWMEFSSASQLEFSRRPILVVHCSCIASHGLNAVLLQCSSTIRQAPSNWKVGVLRLKLLNNIRFQLFFFKIVLGQCLYFSFSNTNNAH